MNKKTIIISITAVMLVTLLTFTIAGKIPGLTDSIKDLKIKYSLTDDIGNKLITKNINDNVTQDYHKKGDNAFITLYQKDGINDFIKIDSFYMNCTEYEIKQKEICIEIPYNYTFEICEEVYNESEGELEGSIKTECHNETEVRYNQSCHTEDYISDNCINYEKLYYSDNELKEQLNLKVKKRLELIANVDRTTIKEDLT